MTDRGRESRSDNKRWKFTTAVSVMVLLLGVVSQLLAYNNSSASELQKSFDLKADKDNLVRIEEFIEDMATTEYVKDAIEGHEAVDEQRYKRMEDLFNLSIEHTRLSMDEIKQSIKDIK